MSYNVPVVKLRSRSRSRSRARVRLPHISHEEFIMKEKYLIFHQGALGDFVLTFPVFLRLRERVSIDVCCQNHLGQLALSLGIADHFFPSESRRFASLFSDNINPELRKFFTRYNRIFLLSFSSELENNIRKITNVPVHRIPSRPPPQEQIHITEYLIKNLNKVVPFKMTMSYTIEIEVENQGFLPTALKQAQLVKIVRPDRITLEFPEDVFPRQSPRTRFRRMSGGRGRQEQEELMKKAKVKIIEPKGNRPYIEIGRIPGNEKIKVKFKIRLDDIDSTKCTIKYTSTRGGVLSKEIVIGKK